MIDSYYSGATRLVPGASNLDTVGIVGLEEGYIVNGVTEFVNIGDFEVTSSTASYGDQAILSITGRNVNLKMNKHYLVNGVEHKSPFFSHDTFDSLDVFNSNYTVSAGITLTLGSARYSYPGSNIIREVVLANSPAMENVRVYTRMAKNSNSLVYQINTCFRYSDEANTLKVIYQNGAVYLQDRNSGYPSGGVTLQTKTGVSITPNEDYHMMTTVFNNRVTHSGSTDGVNYTRHIDYTGIYNWTLPSPNNSGLVAIASAGFSGGFAQLKELMVSEIEDQQTFDSAQKVIFANGGVFACRIQKELDGFGDLFSDTGSSWVSGSSGSITRISSTAGNSWSTLLTTGSTFNDFVLEAKMIGLSGSYPGLGFGSTSSFYVAYLNLDETATQTELYSNNRFFMQTIQTPFTPHNQTVYNLKLIKQGRYASWYVNGLRITEVVGTSLLNNPTAESVRVGLIVSRGGVSVTFSDIKISLLDKLSNTFKIESGDNLSYTSDRFLPEGFVRVPRYGMVDVFERGASRASHVITDVLQNPAVNANPDTPPNLIEVRGHDLVSYTGNTDSAISRYFNKTVSFITNDENIKSSKEATVFAMEVLNEENSNNRSFSVDIDANPTIERFDQVSLIDTTLGVSTPTIVDSFRKTYNSDSAFRETINLRVK